MTSHDYDQSSKTGWSWPHNTDLHPTQIPVIGLFKVFSAHAGFSWSQLALDRWIHALNCCILWLGTWLLLHIDGLHYRRTETGTGSFYAVVQLVDLDSILWHVVRTLTVWDLGYVLEPMKIWGTTVKPFLVHPAPDALGIRILTYSYVDNVYPTVLGLSDDTKSPFGKKFLLVIWF